MCLNNYYKKHQLAVRMRIIISIILCTQPDTVRYAVLCHYRQFFSTTALHLLHRGYCTLVLFNIHKYYVTPCRKLPFTKRIQGLQAARLCKS